MPDAMTAEVRAARTMRREPLGVRLSGRGGQGVMLAGAIFATAAMYDGRHVVETPTYGPEARLGATKVEIVLSEHEIAFPAVEKADLLLCLSRDAYVKYGRAVAPDALVVVDETALPTSADLPPGLVRLPLRAVARELGAEMVTNVLALGAIVGLSDAVSSRSLERAVEEAVRGKDELREVNRRALQAGLDLGRAGRAAGGGWAGGRAAARRD